LPAAFTIAANYKPAGWKPALHGTITVVTGSESCGALPIARPGNVFTPGRHAKTALKMIRCSAEAISEQFAEFIWAFALQVFLNGCMYAEQRRAPGRLDPSNRELSIEYREVASVREALWIDARPRFAGTGSPDARRHPGTTERNSEHEKQWP
jgi:hypothetical protein